MTDFRALCAELAEELHQLSKVLWDYDYAATRAARRADDAVARARAALTVEPVISIDDCPYCTNGLVTVLRNSASYHFDGDEPIAEYEDCEECGGSGKAPPATPPAPEVGEVEELVAALKVIDKMQQEWVLLGNDEDGTASPSLSMPISLRRFTVLRDALSRAADLLNRDVTHEKRLAAALRAVAAQAVPSDAMEPRNNLPMAMENDRIRREILAIAAELDQSASITPTIDDSSNHR
jgi:hypothetical protein